MQRDISNGRENTYLAESKVNCKLRKCSSKLYGAEFIILNQFTRVFWGRSITNVSRVVEFETVIYNSHVLRAVYTRTRGVAKCEKEIFVAESILRHACDKCKNFRASMRCLNNIDIDNEWLHPAPIQQHFLTARHRPCDLFFPGERFPFAKIIRVR